MKIKVGIVSAEPSGDLLGSKILNTLNEQFDEVEVVGIGGGELLNWGVGAERSLLKIMGLVDPLKNYSKIKNFQKQLIKNFTDEKIDVFIGIDSPDFNIGIHRALQMLGIKTIHVVCPSIWAWRAGRAKNFKFIDYMLCLFPFEPELCSNVTNSAMYVGHPLFDKKHEYQCQNKENIVCLMPGSRASEIKHNLSVMIDAFCEFNQTENFKAIIPVYDADSKALIENILPAQKNIDVVQTKSSEVLKKAKIAVMCSGTATLEGLISETPTTIVYKTNFLNYVIYKSMMTTKYVGLPNIIAGKEIFTELIQHDANVDNIVEDMMANLSNNDEKTHHLKKINTSLEATDFSSFAVKLYEDCRS